MIVRDLTGGEAPAVDPGRLARPSRDCPRPLGAARASSA